MISRFAIALHDHLKHLYTGNNPAASCFRFGLLIFHVITIGYFLVMARTPYTASSAASC